MTPSTWPQAQLERLWALQKRARKVNLHLTVAVDQLLHLRHGEQDGQPVDLDQAERAIVAAEAARHE